MSIGKNIYQLRKENNLTQLELAQKIGVSEQTVSKWENDVCCPDVSMFPVLAKLFGVSIDRIFGFHEESYEEEVKKIVKAANDSRDIRGKIEVLTEGLKKYPNSDVLKVELAFSLSVLRKFSKDTDEKKELAAKIERLCEEVLAMKNSKRHGEALNMLVVLYRETGKTELAKQTLERMPVGNFDGYVMSLISIVLEEKDTPAAKHKVEELLWRFYIGMNIMTENFARYLFNEKDYEGALRFIKLNQKIVHMFDEEGETFALCHKMRAHEIAAQIYKAIGNREKCLNELEEVYRISLLMADASTNKTNEISKINRYFEDIGDLGIVHEHFSEVPDNIALLSHYDAFFADSEDYAERYAELKEKFQKIGKK
ncbi:DNA-binding transcriptional regulator, XRE-family HTH domain [Caldanaerobius fijiensis DSM 17918]|uniref:DNA-binding transcriptional regulator, XRE-family HTH domain n=1 Tax=Caldanaerobius fijiensis DSM 17918 TaxID=1121256 RepID=A0A1M4YZR5_9THEO|nr:helix-turn-helix domain-containing protein [Caldanaerobius fijiensis]SHF11304.1 DNA-binding transcriptional regulator, XRE-family HTH domain [Caldanaerobius fijiensis DSM 17918]